MMQAQIAKICQAIRKHNCEVVICAGDIFTKWNSSPELVNFAILHLPKMYAVPGNHDLPEHSYGDITRSAYWTLVMAGTIVNLPNGKATRISDNLVAYGYSGGLYTQMGPMSEGIQLAVVHDYCWIEGHEFPNCPKEKHAMHQATELKKLGFTAGVFGDNHRGFLVNYKGLPPVLNVGGFMRRNSDEKDRQPQLGLLYSDGSIATEEILCEHDEWEEEIVMLPPEDRKEIEDLMEVLSSLKAETIDYGDAVRQCLQRKRVSHTVRRILLRSLT